MLKRNALFFIVITTFVFSLKAQDKKILSILKGAGYDPNKRLKGDQSLLMKILPLYASSQNFQDFLKELIDPTHFGLDPYLKDQNGKVAADYTFSTELKLILKDDQASTGIWPF